MVSGIIGVEWYYEGVRQKRKHVVFNLVISTERVNAVLYLCGGRTDVNPIEHLWQHLKTKLQQYGTPPKGVHDLWDRVTKEWN